ncbi:MAG: AI-2E family transporter [Bryobacteraceae bacterium]
MLGIDARAARYTWTAALVLLVLCLVYLVRSTLFVFIVALLFAYLLAPLVNVIDRILPARRTRGIALALSYLIFIGVLFVAVTQIGSRVIEQANSFRQSLPGLLVKWQQPSPSLPESVNEFKAQIVERAQQQISASAGDIIAAIPKAGAKILSVAGDLIYVVIVPILGFFFLKDGGAIRQHFLDLIDNPSRRAMLDDLLVDVNLLLAHYMRAILLLSAATFVAYSIFFTILGIPYSFLLAALAAALEFIPMIGPLAAGTTIVIVTAVSGGPIVSALIFLLVYRFFQDYVLSPWLMGSGVELHPLFVLFGVFAGAEVAGVPGAFLSVPVLALIRIAYRRIQKARAALRLKPAEPVVEA